MSTTYAISLNEANLDLIEVLNGGVRPALEEAPTVFLFEAVTPTTTENHRIEPETALYDDDGHAKADITFLI